MPHLTKMSQMVFWRFFGTHSRVKSALISKINYLRTCTMSSSGELLNRGALIVFEGCDRCGKSTQSSLLVEYLKSENVPVKHLAFPNRNTPSGSLINSYLTNKLDLPDESIHLLFTLNRWEVQNEMKELLSSGTTLVVDRYSYSGVAYSAAKGLDFEWCKAPERGLIRPDLVFYLKADIESFLNRGNFGKERYEKKEFQQKVAQIFNEIYKSEQEYWTEVDASQSAVSVHKQISVEAKKLIGNVRGADIKLLWR